MPTPTPQQLKFRAIYAQLAANPRDQGTWQVYGDMLLEKNDPRGELIAAYFQPEHAGFDEAVARHRSTLFGPAEAELDPAGPFKVDWYMGTVMGISIKMPAGLDDGRVYSRPWEAFRARLHALVERPVCRWVSSFNFRFDGHGFTRNLLFDLGKRELLTRSVTVEAMSSDFSHHDLPFNGSNFLDAADGLERLSLYGRTTTLNDRAQPFHHEKLRYLELDNDNFFEPDFEALARSQLPSVESLDLLTRSKHSQSRRSAIDEFVNTSGWPALRQLTLSDSYLSNDILEALVPSPMLKQLTSLKVYGGDFDPALLERPEFSHVAIKR